MIVSPLHTVTITIWASKPSSANRNAPHNRYDCDLVSTFSIGQINMEEEQDLKFQTYFFEALKQKAINNYGKAIENLEHCNAIKVNNKAVEFELSKNYLLLKKSMSQNNTEIFS